MLNHTVDFYLSVLEQFEITYFELGSLFLSLTNFTLINSFFLYYRNCVISLEIFFQNKKIFLAKRKLLYIFKKFYLFLQSFFIPTLYLTKNYAYGKIAFLYAKHCFGLFLKKTILLFWRFNIQILRVKFQMGYQQAIKVNFGDHYPFYSRLLNYYPYLLTVFYFILYHNFNGLLFYGFTNTAFLLQNFMISFQSVVGLTLLESI